RQDGTCSDARERHPMLPLANMDYAMFDCGAFHSGGFHVFPVRADKAEGERYVHQPLAALRRGRGEGLHNVQDELPFGLIIARRHGNMWRAGLIIPEGELREILPGNILEGFQEILDGRRLAVMSLEVEVHAGAELLRAENGADHAPQSRSLFVDGCRVEIIDLAVAPRPHGMSQRPLVFGELQRLERAYLPDALDGARALVGRKFMVAKNCQSLLQAELEPVAASDSIACPIVKVFVRDDGFDIG